jgi:hypothetical protein
MVGKQVVLAGLLVCPAGAVDWYVAGMGSDSNDGHSPATAFRNIQTAANLVQPGDVVHVLNGDYTNAYAGGPVVDITRSGTANAWITFQADPLQTPHIYPYGPAGYGWAGFSLHGGASYIQIVGFDVRGPRADVRFQDCISDALQTNPNPACNGNGITIDGRNDPVDGKPHHILIANNRVWQCPGGGIGTAEADYVTVVNNTVSENAWYSRYGNSGISFYLAYNFDNSTATKMIISGNRVYDNRSLVDVASTGTLSDGNGIIIDTSRNTGTGLAAYTGRFLIENNLSFNNGGGGITIFASDHVDAINNTTFKNSQVVPYGEIFVNQSGDVRVENNILYSGSGATTFNTYGATSLSVDYNLYFNGTVNGASNPPGAHDLTSDPLFAVAETDQALADFRPLTGSPAIGSADPSVAPTVDLSQRPRSATAPSRGALEPLPYPGLPGRVYRPTDQAAPEHAAPSAPAGPHSTPQGRGVQTGISGW